jgi:hypothetical protein
MVPGGWEGPQYEKLGTNHSCKKGIEVYSFEGSSPIQKEGGGIITKVQK